MSIVRLESCESTQDEARKLLESGSDDGTAVIATTMIGGKGQNGKAWHAPVGGWYASILLRDVDDASLLTMALGNAVADIVEVAGADAQQKWVNDIMIDGRKVAGVLVEAQTLSNSSDCVVGIGLNMKGKVGNWPDGLSKTATTLEAAIGGDICIEDEEKFMLDTIKGWIRKVRAGRRDEILQHFRDRDFLKGKQVEVDGVTGKAAGVNDEGHLLIGKKAISSGTVTLVE